MSCLIKFIGMGWNVAFIVLYCTPTLHSFIFCIRLLHRIHVLLQVLQVLYYYLIATFHLRDICMFYVLKFEFWIWCFEFWVWGLGYSSIEFADFLRFWVLVFPIKITFWVYSFWLFKLKIFFIVFTVHQRLKFLPCPH